jgi:hypothetical protein
MDYTEAKQDCDIGWIKRKIRNSGLLPAEIEKIFSELKRFENNERFIMILDICRKAQFRSDMIT